MTAAEWQRIESPLLRVDPAAAQNGRKSLFPRFGAGKAVNSVRGLALPPRVRVPVWFRTNGAAREAHPRFDLPQAPQDVCKL